MSKIANLLKIFLKGRSNTKDYGLTSFSQTGEDVIMNFIVEQLRIPNLSYLDVGAHHPQYINNTFLFYNKGFRGVNIEPDPFLIDGFTKIRSQDQNLNIGVGFQEQKEIADFYVMSQRTLNTFSAEEAEKNLRSGTYTVEKIIKVPLVPINSIINEYFPTGCPNILSIDVEGLDFEIVKSLNFKKYRPEVICVETVTYSEDNKETKLNNIIQYISAQDYIIFADTYINTIFVDRKSWQNRS